MVRYIFRHLTGIKIYYEKTMILKFKKIMMNFYYYIAMSFKSE